MEVSPFGLEMRKTDAGLAVVDTTAEKAKKEEEERERRKAEEERSRAAAAALQPCSCSPAALQLQH